MEMPPTVLRDVATRVCGYFRDFLETDFKRQQLPRRRIETTTSSGFRCGLRTSNYPSLDRDLWSQLGRPCGQNPSITIHPRKYTRAISPVMLQVIKAHVEVISPDSLQRVRDTVLQEAVASRSKAIKHPEAWIGQIQSTLASAMADFVIRPLIAHLDGPMRQQAYQVMDSLYGAEIELIERCLADLSAVLPQPLATLLASGNTRPLEEVLPQFLTLDGTKGALLSYFEGFASSDAYLEFRDLDTYVATSEGLQVYLYLGALRHGPHTYPLFFMPVTVEKSADGQTYALQLTNTLYANRRAIDYVLNALAAEHRRAWVTPISDRIIYLHPEQSIYEQARALFALVAAAMDLGGQIDFAAAATDAGTARVKLSSALYLAAAERNDEALVNDYEEIIDMARRGGSAIVDLFEGIVGDVLMSNPLSIKAAVQADWDGLPMVDRVVYDSPIPLNEEQRKVLLAVRQPTGRIVKVSGPPGTGKSHTIVAIAADCAFHQRSCLVLSDKTEALDVVYDKLSAAMSRARQGENFPNPLLRLGRKDANFKRLVSSQTLTQVTSYVNSMKSNRPRIEAARKHTAQTLKGDIAATVQALGAIKLEDIAQLQQFELELEQAAPQVLSLLSGCDNASAVPRLDIYLDHLPRVERSLGRYLRESSFTPESLMMRCQRDAAVAKFLTEHTPTCWNLFESLDADQVRAISLILLSYRQLRRPILGYLFRREAIHALERQLNALPVTQPLVLQECSDDLSHLVEEFHELRRRLAAIPADAAMSQVYRAIAGGQAVDPDAKVVLSFVAALKLVDSALLPSLLDGNTPQDAALWSLAIRYLIGQHAARAAFASAPQIDYVGTKTKLEGLNTSVMNAHVDERLVSFMDNNRSDAKAIAGVLSSGQKFPEDKFAQVREAFPVIIASIREFGEFMPLAPDMFDVVVIDEASQVSVAQALPALLRARKIVVLGDDKQFSNVKSSNASNELNDKYRSDLNRYFTANVSQKADVLERLGMFDIKRSVLDFATLTASYEAMLLKHFRSYPELIGYSSANFYNHNLQAIKIRAKPLEEVIRFDQVASEGLRATRGVNEAEGQFILAKLLDLLEDEDRPTVGVITPFREQQSYLSKLLFAHARGPDFENQLRLKVMTFDSCQGEERHLIFYSMVATPGNDALNYVFPVSFENADQAVEEKLKFQRLNVGFSRAQEMIWFVHSMPLESYRGAIGHAMRHYANVLESSADLPDSGEVESPMEAKVLSWLSQTPFYQAHKESIEIFAQFDLGAYLRQLDPSYQHPAWRVDFLLTYHAPTGTVQIVIEYDGFEYHFQKGKHVHFGNHERYLLESDVERQLTLESYGYRFLRINRFNCGRDPVATLDERVRSLIEMALDDEIPTTVATVTAVAEGLANRDLKTCSRCGEIKDRASFFDKSLKNGAGGHGRVCMDCKTADVRQKAMSKQAGKRHRRRWR